MKATSNENNNKNNSELKIKSIRENQFEAQDIFGEIGQGASKGSEINKFDPDGNLIEGKILDSDDYTIESKTCKYEHGKLVEEVFIDYNDVSSNYTLKMKYDSFGNIIEKKEIVENDKITTCTKFIYDSSQSLIDETSFNEKNEISRRVLFKYDDSNRLIESKYYDRTGFLLHKKTYEYNNQKIKIIEYDKKGDVIIKINYNNYTKNIINDEIIYTGHGRDYERNIFYNDEGLITWEYYGKYDKKFTYNEKNLLLSYEKYYKDDITEKIDYTYEYDDRDSWIKETRFRNGTPSTITIREIEYY